MVELHLAKVDVAGSSPVFRLMREPNMVHILYIFFDVRGSLMSRNFFICRRIKNKKKGEMIYLAP